MVQGLRPSKTVPAMHNLVFHHEGHENREGHERGMAFRGLRFHRELRGLIVAAILLGAANSALAQTLERLTFAQAIDRATKNNPTVAQATTGIMRAEAILQQVRSSSLPRAHSDAGRVGAA